MLNLRLLCSSVLESHLTIKSVHDQIKSGIRYLYYKFQKILGPDVSDVNKQTTMISSVLKNAFLKGISMDLIIRKITLPVTKEFKCYA